MTVGGFVLVEVRDGVFGGVAPCHHAKSSRAFPRRLQISRGSVAGQLACAVHAEAIPYDDPRREGATKYPIGGS